MSTGVVLNREVRAFLRRAGGSVSEGDVAAGTGLALDRVRAALYDLMRTHRCRLGVRDDGTLMYDFGPELVPLTRRPHRERLAAVGRWMWRGFSLAYKASLAIVLVAYAIAFVLLIIAAAVAAAAATRDESPVEGALLLVQGIFRGIFEFATHSALIYADTDRYGYPHGHYEPKQPLLRGRRTRRGGAAAVVPPPKGFVASVYDFVLGPARVEPSPHAQTRELASFVRARGNVLTVRDVQALSGRPRKEAEALFAAFVAEQNGVAEISDQGALYATFDELVRSETTVQDAPIEYYWDEYEPPFELTGNSFGKNALIASLAAFNLFGAYLTMSVLSGPLAGFGFWVGVVPAVIFSLFFAVPLIRLPVVWWRNRRQHRNNIRRRIYREVFTADDDELSAPTVVDRANERAVTEEFLRIEDVGDLVSETVEELGVGYAADAQGHLAADLRQLRIEAQAVEEHAAEEVAEAAAVIHTTDGRPWRSP
ncbi:MAG: hypothetical protein AAF928_03385 [Myxococcota bacterium]